jgi:hypothetical protein
MGWSLVGAVVYLSLGRPPVVGPSGFGFDKVGHLTAYFTLMFWFAMIYQRGRQNNLNLLFFVALGVVLEILQYFTHHRTFENAIGAGLGWCVGATRVANLLSAAERKLTSVGE